MYMSVVLLYRLISETFHFACLLTAATVLPCMCVIGPSLVTWIYVWTWEGSVSRVIFYRIAKKNSSIHHCESKKVPYISYIV